jgi:hypothetical protein
MRRIVSTELLFTQGPVMPDDRPGLFVEIFLDERVDEGRKMRTIGAEW